MFNPDIMSLFWICNQFGGAKKKWNTLHHKGVIFPPDYVPHNIPVTYNGKKIYLNPEAEEAATFYAKFIGTEYTAKSKFNKNFWNDWKKLLDEGTEIKSLDGVDFTDIINHLNKIKEDKANMSKSDKEIDKEKRIQEEASYKIAIIDGKEEPVGNFRVEPPGLFLGRGDNPKLGKIKSRIYPEDVTLNLSSDAPIPPTLPGHHWGQIINDKTVDWLASWKDTITGKTKYVWLGAHSEKKGKNDMAKFDVARKLKKKISTIRKENEENMSNPSPPIRQVATAVYLIDTFALRVGNEKGEDETDTVGVTSLRVEHITLMDNNIIKLDFLGKDSVRYLNVVAVDPIVYKNLDEFTKNKNEDEKLFDLISTNDVNKYLQGFMKDLTAKVFRTYNASYLFYKELQKVSNNPKLSEMSENDKLKYLLDEFNKANLKVAKKMNHQKNVTKSFKTQIDKINDSIKELQKQLNDGVTPAKRDAIKKKIKALKLKKQVKSETKNISLGTSKVNYIDPRITASFIIKHNIPKEKLFTKALLDKFKWAFDVDENYKF